MYNAPYNIVIRGYGYETGSQLLTNEDVMEDFSIRIKSTFLDKNVGSKTRYFLSDDACTSDLATRAAEHALRCANLSVNDIDRLILATSTGDYLSPSTACVVQHKLGGKGFPAYDVGAACSGFIYAVDQAIRSVATGDKHVLVIGVDVRSRTLDKSNKRTAFLYGDGAGAVVISQQHQNQSDQLNQLNQLNQHQPGFIASHLYADGSGHDAVFVPSVGSAVSSGQTTATLTMPNGRRISENAGVGIPSLCQDLLAKTDYTLEDIDFFLFHQPNLFLLESVLSELNIAPHKTLVNFPSKGNTVAASVPIALSEAGEQGLLKTGDLVLLCAVGGGFTGGAHLLRWCGREVFA